MEVGSTDTAANNGMQSDGACAPPLMPGVSFHLDLEM